MSVRSTVLQLVDGEKPWTWNEFAQGCLAWNKVRGSVWTKPSCFDLAYMACSGYQSINVLEKNGFFPKKLFKWGLVIALCGNVALCGQDLYKPAQKPKVKPPGEPASWKMLRGMNVVGTVAEIICEFHQHPMKTAAFVGSILIHDSILERLTSQVSTVFAFHQALLTKNGLFRSNEWRSINATMTKICDAVIALRLMHPMLENTPDKLQKMLYKIIG